MATSPIPRDLVADRGFQFVRQCRRASGAIGRAAAAGGFGQHRRHLKLAVALVIAIVAFMVAASTLPARAGAHRADGVFTLAEGGWLKSGWESLDAAMLLDGSVVVTGEEKAWRVTLDRRRSLIPGFAGTGVTGTADGAALAIEGATSPFFSVPLGEHRILRWAPDAGVSVVAGTGAPGLGGDGGPATAALLNLAPSGFGPSLDDESEAPTGVVARRDGGFVFTDTGNGRIRAVDAAGIIRTIAGGSAGTFRDPIGVAATVDGGYLVTESGWPSFGKSGLPGRLLRVRPDGTIETVLPAWTSQDVVVAADGTAVLASRGGQLWRLRPGSSTPEPYLRRKSPVQPFDFAARPWPRGAEYAGRARVALGQHDDLLIAGYGVLTYVPVGPTTWTLTALRDTRPDRGGVTAEIETTQPGTVTLEISNDDRVVARVTQPVSAGHSMLRAVGLIRDKWYEVRVKLAGASGVTPLCQARLRR
jgi:hypothetical protein